MRRLAITAAISIVLLLSSTTPATAHGGPGGESAPATNYRTRLRSVEPEVRGISVRVIDAGSRLELTNDTGKDVLILGYEDEPYLRITDDGVFENTRSPTTYQNADRYARTAVPPAADADAEPTWRRVTGGQTARWHDHRAHWMGLEDPPAVDANRDREHVVNPDWVIPVRVGDQEVEVRGDLTWVPGPAPTPWYALAALLAVVIAVLSRTRVWRAVLATTVIGMVGMAVVDVTDAWLTNPESTLSKVADTTAPLIAITVALAALYMLRRSPREGVMLAGAAAMGLGLLFGVTSATWLARSQLPTDLQPNLARLTIAASIGLSAGALALVGLRFRELATPPSRSRSST